MTWASGKHGSKPAPGTTKLISWSLPISGSALSGVYSRDRDISSNGNFNRFGGFDARSGNLSWPPSRFRLIPSLFFSGITPDATFGARNRATSPFYISCSVWYS